MKTKLIYVIVSNEIDTYLEQALISVYSARHHNPEATIELVMDEDTAESICGKREEIKKYCTKITRIKVPSDFTQAQRSRFIKTNLRNLIEGDYLFIDTDTIICDKLDDIDHIKWDICAVKELNTYSTFTEEEPWMYQLAEKVGIAKELTGEPYFNSGVMYVKDTPTAHKLYNHWHKNWSEYNQKGLKTDQTPLCMANKQAGSPIKHLDDKWNCQIKAAGLYIAPTAKIIHYFAGMDENAYIFTKQKIFTTLKETGYIPPFIKDLIYHPHNAYIIDADSMAYINDQGDIRNIYQKSKRFFKFLQLISHIYLAIEKRI